MSGKRVKRPHGELRRSQVVSTYGPGSMLDLPKRSVLIAGLDYWSADGRVIDEPRLLEAVHKIPGLEAVQLREPAADTGDFFAPTGGVQAWVFPEWFVTQNIVDEDHQRGIRSRLLLHRNRLPENRPEYKDADGKRHPVVPIRFVRACRRGHIGDINWFGFVHVDGDPCRRQLWLDEQGTTGDLSAITVRCECGQSRPLFDASEFKSRALGSCDGKRPWFGANSDEPCTEPNRLLIRTASNAYFAQRITVISIPSAVNEELRAAVNSIWDRFEDTKSRDEVSAELKRSGVQKVLGSFDQEEVVGYVLEKHGGGSTTDLKPKEAEFATLGSQKKEMGSSLPGSEFHAEELPRESWDCPEMQSVQRVLLVNRLREVSAQVSFTRFESVSTDIHGELDAGVQRASLMKTVDWVPAVETRGEGLFLAFSRAAIDEWRNREAVQTRGQELSRGFSIWAADRPQSGRDFAGLPYIMLHSLSHLLLTTISLNCGYPASAIKERIYAGHYGYGILLYTGTPDSEGTLGGLVEAGRAIREHFQDALRRGTLCSNDPVCAAHDCTSEHDHRYLQGAACHGCLLIAEPSCEMHNDFLDRALVVPTVVDAHAAFFAPGDNP